MNQTPPTSDDSPPVEIICSRHFLPWLHEQYFSIALTTYQSCRLFLLGLKPDGKLSAFERMFDRAMGLYAESERLYMSSKYQLWQFENALAPDELHEGYDRLYVPRIAYTTGDLDIHDMAVDNEQNILFINTLYSCLATLSDRYSFTPLWKPPFISRLAPEDRCHLNGLAMVDGEPRYVTAVSQSDVTEGWRERRDSGGCLIDIQSDDVILTGLSMPHSPRFYRDKLWLLNSGTGEFGYVDLDAGVFEPVTFCPGYLRGLAFYGNFAFMGLSKPRRNKAFTGLALDERLDAKEGEARCGFMVVDLKTGDIVHWLEMQGVITELYDVQVLPGVRCPTALGSKTDEICRLITIDPEGKAAGDAVRGSISMAPSALEPTPAVYQYETFDHVDMKNAIKYDALSFPSLRKRWQVNPSRGPLFAVTASFQRQIVGAALAEMKSDEAPAELISLFVTPDHRDHGVGGSLLVSIEQALAGQGCEVLELNYRSDWPGVPALEHIIRQQEWQPPQTPRLLCKTTAEKLAEAPWVHNYSLPADFTIFPWTDLTSQERQEIQKRQEQEQWYPPVLTPFQEEDRLEPLNSLGMRYEGRVVGWMITHRTTPDTIQYTSLFVEKELQQQGRAIPLAAEAIKLQIEGEVPFCIWMLDTQNEPVLKFINRHVRPYLTSIAESRYTQKRLGI